MAVTNQLSLCMPDLGLVRLIVQFQTLWKLVNGLMSCAPNLEMLIGKPVTGKRSEAAKDNNLQPTDAMGKKNTCFFHDVFSFCWFQTRPILYFGRSCWWVSFHTSVPCLGGNLSGVSVSSLFRLGTWWKWEQLRMDLCDYDLSLPPDHPYNLAVEFLGCLMSSQEGLVLKTSTTWFTRDETDETNPFETEKLS